MLIQKSENTHCSYVKRLTAILYDKNRHNESKHFCERCSHGYTTKDLLQRRKTECKGLLKRPTRIELPKEGKNKVSSTNYHKQMKTPFVIYADLESLLRKIPCCDLPKTQEKKVLS